MDGRSDLFALGSLLYECVAGRPAFSGANVIEIGAQVLHVDPPPPSQFNSRIPAELDRVAMKALAKKPEERYQTAAEMADDLEAVRVKLPVTDPVRTRRIAGPAGHARSSMLVTMADKLRRPRISPLAFLGAFALAMLAVWGYLYWRSPSLHEPNDAARKLYDQGLAAMRDGAFYKAADFFEQVVKEDDKFAFGHARLAETLAELDYLDRAMEKLLSAEKLIPERSALGEGDRLYLDAIHATVTRDWASATTNYEQLVKLNPDSAQVYVDLGRVQEKNNETEKAMQSYTEATNRDQANAAAFTRLGVVCARRKNLPCASNSFEHAEKLYEGQKNVEGLTEALYQKGRLFGELGRGAEAKRALEKSLELATNAKNRYQQVQALTQLSPVLAAESKVDDAVRSASQALQMAQADNMYNLAVRAMVMLASVHILADNYVEAEKLFDQALNDARNYKMLALEAMALINKGSLLHTKLNRSAEARPLIEQALEYYRKGNYRKEADAANMLLARIKKKQGDYTGALEDFRNLLEAAKKSGDRLQIGTLQREFGAVLLLQDRFPEAEGYFRESTTIFKSLEQKVLQANSLLQQWIVFWKMGRFDEADAALGQASALAGGNKDSLPLLHLARAWHELSRGANAEAKSRAAEALSLGCAQVAIVIEAKSVLCLAAARSGSAAQGKADCEEAVRKARGTGDPWYVSNAELSLAEALLAAGDAGAAREAAERVREAAERAGRTETLWRALAIAGTAGQRLGATEDARAELSRASELLTQLGREWGEEALSVYLTRPDLKPLRKELDGLNTAAPRP